MTTIPAAYIRHQAGARAGVAYTGPNAEGDLARSLIGEGVDPACRLVFSRAGVPQLLGSVNAFASKTYGASGRMRWAPHPRGTYAPALLAWRAGKASKARQV